MHRKKLRQQRVIKNITVPQFAGLLGISQSYYYKIEQGTRNPTITLASKIADILDTTINEIFFDPFLDEMYKTSNKEGMSI